MSKPTETNPIALAPGRSRAAYEAIGAVGSVRADPTAAVVQELRREMDSRRLTAPALALRSSVPERTVRSILQGRQDVNVRQLAALAVALRVPLSDLVRRAEGRSGQ